VERGGGAGPGRGPPVPGPAGGGFFCIVKGQNNA